jgi:hypothetical protein
MWSADSPWTAAVLLESLSAGRRPARVMREIPRLLHG